MAIAKKDRFLNRNICITLKSSGDIFPLKEFDFKGIKLMLLGVSNKSDLDVEDEGNRELLYASSIGRRGQFIYTDLKGNLYDSYIYEDTVGNNILLGIKTRS